MDTAAKRSSAILVGSPWRGLLPFPDATIGQGDRQAVAFLYSGISAVAGFVAGGIRILVKSRQTRFVIPQREGRQ